MSQRESAIPRHPSNRKVIEQMKLWGWTIGKQDGRWQQMLGAPVGATKSMTLAVRPATQHDANPTAVFLEIYRLTTGGDAEVFWEGPPDPQAWADMISQAWAKEKRRIEAEQADQLAKAAEYAQRQAILDRAEQRRQERLAVSEKPKPVKVSHETPRKPRKEERMPTPKPSNKLIHVDPDKVAVRSTDVFAVLVNNDRPMNTMAIVKEMGLEPTTRNIRDVANRCVYLANKGLATRVLNGTYRAAGQGHAIAARIQHDVSTVSDTAKTKTTTAPAPNVNGVIESLDDTIEAVLDLLLPEGFRAADLRFIAPWVDTTKHMVEEVTKHRVNR